MNITTLSVEVFGQPCTLKIEDDLANDINENLNGSCGYAFLSDYAKQIEESLEDFYYLQDMMESGNLEGVKNYVESNYYLGYDYFASTAPWTFGEHIMCDVEQFEPSEIDGQIRLFDCEKMEIVTTNKVSTHLVLWSHDS